MSDGRYAPKIAFGCNAISVAMGRGAEERSLDIAQKPSEIRANEARGEGGADVGLSGLTPRARYEK